LHKRLAIILVLSLSGNGNPFLEFLVESIQFLFKFYFRVEAGNKAAGESEEYKERKPKPESKVRMRRVHCCQVFHSTRLLLWGS